MADHGKPMKAYKVYDRNRYSEFVVITFAETRGKAITNALGTDEFPYEYWDYTEMRAHRCPELDKYYRGKYRMDWDDPNDRLAMIKDAGLHCDEDSFDQDECEKCTGKEYCSRYEEYLEEEAETDG